uniref:Uncharacterized protein n=1 Tax=Chromera velia CCMP2878 TaxID=1169474 RepID=A0A0G4HWY7_9ALVE|eukprot:Cvel_1470.t1-p1 / transcript=Cvel_1470.t1 / gene=Cvel_1470 / organism=Chromera_velia_CCMP2878 / gene_product=hypothetical protein / transcript_product=hypothetical protein / location=Cvel_scaffold51:137701-138108(+) / protein_length=136 / sequence_SO=supercontig / SO=protein_coding / is_pseudo=false
MLRGVAVAAVAFATADAAYLRRTLFIPVSLGAVEGPAVQRDMPVLEQLTTLETAGDKMTPSLYSAQKTNFDALDGKVKKNLEKEWGTGEQYIVDQAQLQRRKDAYNKWEEFQKSENIGSKINKVFETESKAIAPKQ